LLQIFKGTTELSRLVESAGPEAERIELAPMGATIGNQLSQGEANRWIANQLFGLMNLGRCTTSIGCGSWVIATRPRGRSKNIGGAE
jgi:hypothetical protein